MASSGPAVSFILCIRAVSSWFQVNGRSLGASARKKAGQGYTLNL